jgi:hypothetical protein
MHEKVRSNGAMTLSRENRNTEGEKPCPRANFSNTNLTLTGLVLNPGLRRQTDHISGASYSYLVEVVVLAVAAVTIVVEENKHAYLFKVRTSSVVEI